jgi:hypothetical protein
MCTRGVPRPQLLVWPLVAAVLLAFAVATLQQRIAA